MTYKLASRCQMLVMLAFNTCRVARVSFYCKKGLGQTPRFACMAAGYKSSLGELCYGMFDHDVGIETLHWDNSPNFYCWARAWQCGCVTITCSFLEHAKRAIP
jgi:hypothetical protein